MAMFAAQENKIGNFDWITDYDEIEEYLQNKFTGLERVDRDKVRVLVVGCGTSKLSVQLADSGFEQVVSVDNDGECISHMKKMHDGDERLRWYTYDMVEPESLSCSIKTDLGKFDLIVDKGTLDAILVEGAIYTMLYEVHSLLNIGGAYVIFSLNTENLLKPLLDTDALGYDVRCHKIQKKVKSVSAEPIEAENLNYKTGTKNTIGHNKISVAEEYTEKFLETKFEEENSTLGTVVICRKVCHNEVDIDQLMLEEQLIMDNYFKVELPFLTKEQEEKIRDNFEGRFLALNSKSNSASSDVVNINNDNDHHICLSIQDAYNAMFGDEEALEYSFDLFLEDIESYPLGEAGHMTIAEAISFLHMMQ